MLSSAALKEAAQISEQIEALQGRYNQLMGGATGATSTEIPTGIAALTPAAPVAGSVTANSNGTTAPRKRRMSRAGRERIAAAQRARWAKQKSGAK